MIGPGDTQAASVKKKILCNEALVKKTPFFNEYSINKDILGNGINGNVVKCCNDDGRMFALKVLKDTPKARQEIHLHWSSCECEHIVNIVDVFENIYRGHPCLLVVMELMEGELFEKIITHTSFNEKEAAQIIKNICTAVKYLHDRNIAHRDLKPENVLYRKCGDVEILKLTDFGFAKLSTTGKALQSPYYTPYYVAPEILGPERYGKSCDIWSLGVILYILLSGHPPFYSYNDGAISPGMKNRIRTGCYDFGHSNWDKVSSEAKNLIEGCLQIDVEKRFTIDQVLIDKWMVDNEDVPETPIEWKGQDAKKEYLTDIPEEHEQSQQQNRVKKLKMGNSALMKRRLMKMFGQSHPSTLLPESN